MNIVRVSTPNKWPGGNRCEVIIIHWWDRPESKPSLNGVVTWFENPTAQVSAHYVVSDETVYQLCAETDRAWHARQANDFAIGIEVDPNTPGRTYETVAALVKGIRSRRGPLPLKRHKDYVQTDCPGEIDVERIDNLAKGEEVKVEDVERLMLAIADSLNGTAFGRKAKDKENPEAVKAFMEGTPDKWIKKLLFYPEVQKNMLKSWGIKPAGEPLTKNDVVTYINQNLK